MPRRRRILFIAEAVTLAHVGRPLALGQSLDPSRYELVLACDPRYRSLFPSSGFDIRTIFSISSQQFLAALSKGRPVYDKPTLKRYVEDDLILLGDVQPDAVVGDFRLSLSVSARHSSIPYAAITNAYWSPYARQSFPVPELPWVRFTGPALGSVLFRLARPFAFAYHARPLNSLRVEYGLPSLGRDVRNAYTDGDVVLYADSPELIPTAPLPASHHFIGPVLWSPEVALPEWWEQCRRERPLIYVTLGSSGPPRLLPIVLSTLADLPITIAVATAGRSIPRDLPPNVFAAAYLPGDRIVAEGALVVCNGGSPTAYQGLAAGVPVLGIASNLDQFLNMQAVQAAGAGLLLRADRLTAASVKAAASELLTDSGYTEQARRLARTISPASTYQRFAALLEQLLTRSAGV